MSNNGGHDPALHMQCNDFVCNSCNRSNIAANFERGDFVCMDCGLCAAQLTILPIMHTDDRGAARACKEMVLANPLENSPVGGSSRYDPKEYFRTRINLWAQIAPVIPSDDWDEIEFRFRDFCRNRFKGRIPSHQELQCGNGRQLSETVVLARKEVLSILTACDDRLANEGQEKRFVRLYLSGWLVIRYRFSGVRSTYFSCSPFELEQLEQLFAQVLKYKLHEPKFNLNFNFIFRRLFDLIGRPDCCDDFPRQKTVWREKKNIDFWIRNCTFNKWPYINSDKI